MRKFTKHHLYTPGQCGRRNETTFHPLSGHMSVTGGTMGQIGNVSERGRSIPTRHEYGYPQLMWLGATMPDSNSNSSDGWVCSYHHKGIMRLRCDCWNIPAVTTGRSWTRAVFHLTDIKGSVGIYLDRYLFPCIKTLGNI